MVRMTEVEMANVQIVCALSAILRIRDIAPLCTLTLRLKRPRCELSLRCVCHQACRHSPLALFYRFTTSPLNQSRIHPWRQCTKIRGHVDYV